MFILDTFGYKFITTKNLAVLKVVVEFVALSHSVRMLTLVQAYV